MVIWCCSIGFIYFLYFKNWQFGEHFLIVFIFIFFNCLKKSDPYGVIGAIWCEKLFFKVDFQNNF